MIQFPASPTIGQIFEPVPGNAYKWNGTGWAPFSAILTKEQADALYIALTQKGAVNGVATLDSVGKVPTAQLHLGEANGVASLDATGKLPEAQLPDVALTDAEAALIYIPLTHKATPNGVATLDSAGYVVQGSRAPSGSAPAPTFSFSAANNTGMWWSSGQNSINFSIAGADVMRVAASTLVAPAAISFGTGIDVVALREAANTLALRNGVSPQTFRIYNTFTDAANYERGTVEWAGNEFRVIVSGAGTGSSGRSLGLYGGGSAAIAVKLGVSGTTWNISTGSTLPIVPSVDNTLDFGTVTARARMIYWGTQALAPNGSAATPSYSFAGFTGTGIFSGGAAGRTGFSDGAGASQFGVSSGGAIISNGGSLNWSNTAGNPFTAVALSLGLDQGAADILSQKRGTNPQAQRLYNTFTDFSNYERGVIGWTANSFNVTTDQAGTGVARSLNVGTTGAAALNLFTTNTIRWLVQNDGHFKAFADNVYDVGAAAAGRPRNIYAGTGMFVGASPVATHDDAIAYAIALG